MTQLDREYKSALIECEEQQNETIAWQIIKARAVARGRLASKLSRTPCEQSAGQGDRKIQGNNDMPTAPCLDPVSS